MNFHACPGSEVQQPDGVGFAFTLVGIGAGIGAAAGGLAVALMADLNPKCTSCQATTIVRDLESLCG